MLFVGGNHILSSAFLLSGVQNNGVCCRSIGLVVGISPLVALAFAVTDGLVVRAARECCT